MKSSFCALFLSSIFLCACASPKTETAVGEVRRFPLKGKVIAVDKSKKTATIAHEEVKGYMDAMTMDFPIKDDWVWEDLTPESEIRAELVVSQGDFWLEKIGILALPKPGQTPLPNPQFTEILGREISNYPLTNQDAKRISMNDFRGKAFAITFIYTRCPLPNYCIAMSQRFSDATKLIEANPELKSKVRLLSVSFDPEHDTPAVLKNYGLGYLGKDSKSNFEVWQLATGSASEISTLANSFGLKYERDPNDKDQIIHSLRTAVIAPDGKVKVVLRGSDWTAEDLVRELQDALK
jgi:protein SCO1/2